MTVDLYHPLAHDLPLKYFIKPIDKTVVRFLANVKYLRTATSMHY